jgi:hypothetical protein
MQKKNNRWPGMPILKKRAKDVEAAALCDALREVEYSLMKLVEDHPFIRLGAAGALIVQARGLRRFRYQVDEERGFRVDIRPRPQRPATGPSPYVQEIDRHGGWSETFEGDKGPARGAQR